MPPEISPGSDNIEQHFILGGKREVNPFDPISQPEEYADFDATQNDSVKEPGRKKPIHKFKSRSGPHKEYLN